MMMADTWQVVAQRQTEQLNPAGNGFATVIEVTFQITAGPASGTTGVVVVPIAAYTPDTVHDMIEARVQAMTEVASL
jgi:hypothetical protein